MESCGIVLGFLMAGLPRQRLPEDTGRFMNQPVYRPNYGAYHLIYAIHLCNLIPDILAISTTFFCLITNLDESDRKKY